MECSLEEKLFDDLGVGCLMAGLVPSYVGTQLCQLGVPVTLGQACSGTMRDLGGTLLKLGVNETCTGQRVSGAAFHSAMQAQEVSRRGPFGA